MLVLYLPGTEESTERPWFLVTLVAVPVTCSSFMLPFLISLFYHHLGTQESICSPPLWEGFWPLEGSGGMDFSLVKSSVEHPLGRHCADPCF